MTTRREALLALPLFCAPRHIRAQVPKAGPPKRLGVIAIESDSPIPPPQRPLYIGLRQKGWILGDNLLREPAYADWQYERLAGLAEELVRKRVDAIVAVGDHAAVAAARATRTIPIVFTTTAYPVETGLIDSEARPGRNVTGWTLTAGPEVNFKRLGLLREIVPAATRVSWLVGAPPYLETVGGGRLDRRSAFIATAKELGFEARLHYLRTPQDIDTVFSEVIAWPAQAVGGQGFEITHARQRLGELLLRHRLPSAFNGRHHVEAGGLMSYGVSQADGAYGERRFVEYVDSVLGGTPPAQLPVERPRSYELVINMRTANALGLTIPQSMLLTADEVIQ